MSGHSLFGQSLFELRLFRHQSKAENDERHANRPRQRTRPHFERCSAGGEAADWLVLRALPPPRASEAAAGEPRRTFRSTGERRADLPNQRLRYYRMTYQRICVYVAQLTGNEYYIVEDMFQHTVTK
eukprot:188552-Pleurochrysis_carterae.AAC.2